MGPAKSPLGSVAQHYTHWESRQAERGWTPALQCTCGLGNVCFFRPERELPSIQQISLAFLCQASKIFCVLLLASCLCFPWLPWPYRHAWNIQRHTWASSKYVYSAVCRSCSEDQPHKHCHNKWLCFMTFSHQAIFMLKPIIFLRCGAISHIYLYTYMHTNMLVEILCTY